MSHKLRPAAIAMMLLISTMVVQLDSEPADAHHVTCTATAWMPWSTSTTAVGRIDQVCTSVVNQQVFMNMERKVCGFWGCNYHVIGNGSPRVRVDDFNMTSVAGDLELGWHRYRTSSASGTTVWFDHPGGGRAYAGYLIADRELHM
jgi:hypothetical protein